MTTRPSPDRVALPRRSRRLKRRPASVLLAVAIVLTVLSVATPASALTVSRNVTMRPCVDTANRNCASVGSTGSARAVKMRCWRDGSWATGAYRSNRWFLMVLSDGREGYVHSSHVRNQTATPNCRELSYVRAADWAIAQIGKTHAPSNLAARYTDWAPGPLAEWSGDCAKFAHMAYQYGAGVSFARASASGQYRAYKNVGRILGGIPRYGAPVFYDIARPHGHVAIYIGGTTIVTTRGLDHANLTVERRDLSTYSNYLGWAAV